ncbi:MULTISPECIES: glycosyltransferase [unclassified Nocardioides]|uniref:glycosyltransferase n=1 Tax=unclassified Nocardioides TaxID=2615069 RepID=UPI000702F08E|nr:MULTISPECIES: glycosyltransferase [unclassified Nocardioides]KRC56969.1 hypothetical protein ASE19_03980 [Nocardioides sp. Root79]KRC77178.1 hypothetical protein ASE20_02845 [Nocardioides sp. Root240]
MIATLGVVVLCTALMWMTAVGLLWLAPTTRRAVCMAAIVAAAGAGAALAHLAWPDRAALLPAGTVALTAVVLTMARGERDELSPAGRTAWVAWLLFGASTLVWAVLFVAGLELSTMSTGLLWLAMGVSALTLPSAAVTTREGWEPLLQRRRRSSSLRVVRADVRPRVSIHVPCHAEPPELVISTLERLAALDYDDFEVLVIDNNTTDPALWLPVQEHCRLLGDRFRFFHVEGITGAKAGALNWALPHTDPAAEVIAVVDADYHVEPGWLRDTVGRFADPQLGFVQCPHAYRDHEHSRFATWANWEYAVFFQTGMVSLDNRGAGLTVGTMSLIRKQALVDAGGWAEWCLTEDSELSIRIHAAGYSSVYLTEAYGRGLVPETFEAYRRQRFRWTYGPVQELRHHWRLFLPGWLGGRPSRLTKSQRLHHANHGIDVIGIGVRAVVLVLGIATGFSLIAHGETLQMPFELWFASTAALLGSWLMRLLVYRRCVGATVAQTVGAIVAFAALSLVITVATLRATIGLSSAWHRTSKFQERRNWRSALAGARTETLAGGACAAVALGLFVFAPGSGGVVVMLGIALLAKGLAFLSSPVLALVADRDLPGVVPAPVAVRRDAELLSQVS